MRWIVWFHRFNCRIILVLYIYLSAPQTFQWTQKLWKLCHSFVCFIRCDVGTLSECYFRFTYFNEFISDTKFNLQQKWCSKNPFHICVCARERSSRNKTIKYFKGFASLAYLQLRLMTKKIQGCLKVRVKRRAWYEW